MLTFGREATRGGLLDDLGKERLCVGDESRPALPGDTFIFELRTLSLICGDVRFVASMCNGTPAARLMKLGGMSDCRVS